MMKHLPICLALIGLSACSRAPETIDEIKTTIEGRWVFNPDYCKNRIAETGFVDVLIENGGIETSKVLAKGRWYAPPQQAELQSIVATFINTQKSDCEADLPDGSPLFINFESFEQAWTLAYFPSDDLILRISGKEVVVAKRFDEDYHESLLVND